MLRRFANLSPVVRNLCQIRAKHDHGHGRPGSIPGKNIPLNLDRGIASTTLLFIVFFGIPLAAPFLVVWRQLARK